MTALLEIKELSVRFGTTAALRSISFNFAAGAQLVIVGESGSGKSTLGLSILGLLPRTAEVIGKVRFRGAELPVEDDRAMNRIRGDSIGFIHQDPMSAFSPVHTIGTHLFRAFRANHPGSTRREAEAAAIRLLDEVQISRARERLDHYPHQYSGGMLQRVMIAAALIGNPALLIADEPTTALDATTQASVLRVLANSVSDRGMSLMLITHDLGVVAEVATDVAVMYGGRLIQYLPIADLPAAAHPYTQALLKARPSFGRRGHRLPTIADLLPAGWDADA
ncbi:MAG: ABC transporter ATP-binding protein [Albidovulum sp.]|nr:ABC transporter ATP-binding protein [Albidovulum sp.]